MRKTLTKKSHTCLADVKQKELDWFQKTIQKVTAQYIFDELEAIDVSLGYANMRREINRIRKRFGLEIMP